jgi:hypothetical protein
MSHRPPFTIATWGQYIQFARQLSAVGDLLDVRIPYFLSPRIMEGRRAGGTGRLDRSGAMVALRLPAPLQVKVRSFNDDLASPWMSFERALLWCHEVIEQ